jgi:hypothetical protein
MALTSKTTSKDGKERKLVKRTVTQAATANRVTKKTKKNGGPTGTVVKPVPAAVEQPADTLPPVVSNLPTMMPVTDKEEDANLQEQMPEPPVEPTKKPPGQKSKSLLAGYQDGTWLYVQVPASIAAKFEERDLVSALLSFIKRKNLQVEVTCSTTDAPPGGRVL